MDSAKVAPAEMAASSPTSKSPTSALTRSESMAILKRTPSKTSLMSPQRTPTALFPKVTGVPRSLWFSRLRATVFETFDNSQSSRMGFAIYSTIMCFIVLSIVTFCMATDPAARLRKEKGQYSQEDSNLDSIETVVVIIFTIEYLSRLLTCSAVPNKREAAALAAYAAAESAGATSSEMPDLPVSYNSDWPIGAAFVPAVTNAVLKVVAFLTSPLNIIDLAAIAPYYVELADATSLNSSLTPLRVLRLARVLRVLRISKRSAGFRLLSRTLELSLDALAMLLYIITLAVVLFGSIIFYCESGDYDETQENWFRPTVSGSDIEISPFRSIPVAFWWAVVTITTVGYGDMFPTTACGRSIGSIVIISGMLALAMPITIIGANFNDEFDRYKANVALGGDGFGPVPLTPDEMQEEAREAAMAQAQKMIEESKATGDKDGLAAATAAAVAAMDFGGAEKADTARPRTRSDAHAGLTGVDEEAAAAGPVSMPGVPVLRAVNMLSGAIHGAADQIRHMAGSNSRPGSAEAQRQAPAGEDQTAAGARRRLAAAARAAVAESGGLSAAVAAASPMSKTMSLADRMAMAQVATAAAQAASASIKAEMGYEISQLKADNAWLKSALAALLSAQGVPTPAVPMSPGTDSNGDPAT